MEVSSGYDSHSHGKSPFLIGKPSINGSFSMAMLNNQMVSSTESSSTPGHIRSPRYHQAPAMPGSAFKVLSMPASWLSKPILSCFKRFTMACRSGIPWDTLGYLGIPGNVQNPGQLGYMVVDYTIQIDPILHNMRIISFMTDMTVNQVDEFAL